jgi:hypothetical protein
VELMACLVFLSLAVYPMLACISGATARSMNAQERMVVLGLVEDQLESCRSTARTSALTLGTTTTTLTPGTVYTPVIVTKVISAVAGYTDLFQVAVTATWGSATLPNRNGSITLTAYMRAPLAY